MAILPLIIAPDPRLKKKSDPVETVDDSIRELLNNMLATMYHSEGIGLAAVQVGVHKRCIVVDTEWRGELGDIPGNPIKLINPEITWDSDEDHTHKEGCLAFPDQFADVVRPKEVKVKYLDENGKPQELHATGLLATCIQHEIDHINGVVFVDHISYTRRDAIHRKLDKLKRQGYFDHDHSQCGHDHHHHADGEAL